MKLTICMLVLLCFPFLSPGQQLPMEKIEFSRLRLEIEDFISETQQNIQPEQKSFPDTVIISENPCEDNGYYIRGNTLKIIPKFKGDSYEIKYALQAQLNQQYDPEQRQTGHPNSQPKILAFQTEYLKIQPSGQNEFKLPKEINVEKYLPLIRQKFAFRDTSVTVPGEVYQHHFNFTKEGKLYELNWQSLLLKITIVTEKKRKISQFVVIYLSEGCD